MLPLARSSTRTTLPIEPTYREYFLQYASYVITDRAIPDVADGLKPVQRRLMHAMRVMDDGRYHKVANIIGQTMQYHPHGDTSIGAALVGMGQFGLLVDTQGNWGDPVTGDPAAASRYIEARLTAFAREVLFAPHLTRYKKSYDGRNKEPITLPARFPILLLTGTEGIAVGLSTRVLPHNFIEVVEALKAALCKEPFELYPDFPGGGLADASDYNDGCNGAKVKVRARIEKGEGKTIEINEIPYGTHTSSLIDSIISAGDKGKIKISHIEDNTAAEVNIKVTFQRGVDLDNAIDALYAFTDCEVAHSPNGMVIVDTKPRAMSVSDMVRLGAESTKALLKRDLEYRLEQLELRWHHKSLVQIFIENRIYLRIEKCTSFETILREIDKGLKPFKGGLRREVVEDDLVMLTEVKMRRISAYDAERAQEELLAIDKEIAGVKKNLGNLTKFTIAWFDHLLEAYGAGRERRTDLVTFSAIQAVKVVERTEKLFVDRRSGFIGTALKNAEEIGPCSSIDDVIVFLEDGGMSVVKAEEKAYIGDRIIHVQVFRPEDRESVFNLIYEDRETGKAWIKRFTIGGVTRGKLYDLASNAEKARVLYFVVDQEPCLYVKLKKKPRIRTDLYLGLGELLVKNRGAGGNVLTKHRISSIKVISAQKYEEKRGEL